MTTVDIATQFFPARSAFYAHRDLTKTRVKVYHHCLSVFDFMQVRTVPLDAFEIATGIYAPDVSTTLTWLVREGFLTEHQRGHRGSRQFTLTWSVAPQSAVDSAVISQVIENLGKS